jgi:hypothetical protein
LKEIDKKVPSFRNGVRKHWEKTIHILEGSEGEKVIISAKNLIRIEEDGIGLYGDHITNKQYRVDFTERKLIECSQLDDVLESKKQELVEVISNVLKKYLEEFFSKGSHLYGKKNSL